MNRRQTRTLQALLTGQKTRNEVDQIAGASNGPEVIRQLRCMGLTIAMVMTPGTDRDGQHIRYGTYSLTEKDITLARHMLHSEARP